MASQQPEQDIDRRKARSNESLQKQIQLAKHELTDHFQNYHRMLDEKEQALISELNAILISVDDLHEKRRELKQTQGTLEEKMKRNEFQAMKDELLEVVNAELGELEHQVSASEREVVELGWRDSELLAAIRDSCSVLKGEPTANTSLIQDFIPYSDRLVPLWSVGTRGAGDGQLENPRCVTVDAENEDLYVADEDNHRIVVFTKNGLFVRNLTVRRMKWLLVSEVCYISTNTANGFILKVSKETGKELSSLDPGVEMLALTLDKETGMLLACPRYNNSILYIEFNNLDKVSELPLHTPYFIKNTTKIYDLKILRDELYILFSKSLYPLQSFSRDGNLLRTIIPQDSVGKIFYFCIDLQGNFIVSDDSTDKLLVFSSTGNVISTMGRDKTEKSEPGELYCPRGVALKKDNRIIVCDVKSKNMLQLF